MLKKIRHVIGNPMRRRRFSLTRPRSNAQEKKVRVRKTSSMTLDTSSWHLRDPQISARGAKSCPVQNAKGEKVFFTLGSKSQPLSTPFGATSFNDEATTRKTIEFNLSPEQEDFFQRFDEWAVGYLSEHSERLFRKKLSPDQVREGYRSPVTKKAGYRGHLRCKINSTGVTMVRCWSTDDKRRDMPVDLRTIEMVPRINVSHLWMMSREYGWVMQVNDLMICEGEELCPFAE